MAKTNRPPLEIDDLTNNLRASSGKGIGAFFPPSPQGEALPPAGQANSPALPGAASHRDAAQRAPHGRSDVTTPRRQLSRLEGDYRGDRVT